MVHGLIASVEAWQLCSLLYPVLGTYSFLQLKFMCATAAGL
jgi:hypothetical protein